MFARTYHEWELLFVDDGSTDTSSHIALEHRDKNPKKLFYLGYENHMSKGIIASRNLGIQNARVEYITMLDVVDVGLANKLEQQIALLEKFPKIRMAQRPTKYWYN